VTTKDVVTTTKRKEAMNETKFMTTQPLFVTTQPLRQTTFPAPDPPRCPPRRRGDEARSRFFNGLIASVLSP